MTNVIILAAGVGSRLRPITDLVPKCMISINDVPLIERLVNQLKSYGNSMEIKINVVLGYKSEVVIDYFKTSDINFIINEDYEVTNNMYSFYLATKNISNLLDMVVINADCIYENEIIEKCLNSKTSCIMADYNFFNEESMKIEVINDIVKGIAKTYEKGNNIFTSIDMYKLFGNESKEMISHVAEVINSGERNSWTEVAINEIVKNVSVRFKPLSIDKLRWYEIDNHADFEIASKLFLNEGNV